MSLFTSFEGSIGRGQFWLGMIILVAVAIAVVFVAGPLLAASPSAVAIFGLVVSLAMLYPACAIITKRLHDRGKPMNPWLWIFVVPGLALNAMQAFGIGFTPVDMGGTVFMQPSGLGLAVSLVAFVVGVWGLIELGILKGRI